MLQLVEARFASNFGSLAGFDLATDHDQAEQLLAHFLEHNLPDFGAYQDAMLSQDPVMYHALISSCLNVGLLDPLEVCRRAEAEFIAGRAPLNSVEGFIRQILGWREYVRGIYFHEGAGYTSRNELGHTRPLPEFYWNANTDMNCLASVVSQTRDLAYAHHIQRLMIAGNFALLAGVDPGQVHMWYLSVYSDAFEWVEAPNTLGMSQFADGGIVASKPYVSSGKYIDRMSDYCTACRYDVKARTGNRACPFNALYWHFLDRHRDRFIKNPRMAQMYRAFDRMDEETRDKILVHAEDTLAAL